MIALAIVFIAALAAVAQGPPPGPHDMDNGGGHGPPPHGPSRGGGQRPSDSNGVWWNNRAVVERLRLSDSQQKRIDQIVQQSRLRLIDLRAALEKQELMLDPLLAEDRPRESDVLPQIDRVAAARADLERANARMLFEVRLVLTPEQWKELQSRQPRSRYEGK